MERRSFTACEFVFLIGAILCVAVAIGGCRREETHAFPLPEKTPVIVRPVTQMNTEDTVFISGALEADKTAPLSFLVPGMVDRVYVDEGDRVEKGQVLASVEAADYRSHLRIAEALLMQAKDAYERFRPLYKEGAFAEKNFIELKSGLAQAAAGCDIARKKLKDTKLYTPIPGVVGMKRVEIGQMVSPAMPVFTVVKTDTIYARVSVPESEIGKIALGQKAEAKVPALANRSVEGRVMLIGAMADPQTRSFAVKIELPNPDYTLRTGMIVQAKIITDRQIDILTVPGSAVVRDADNLTYVFVVDAARERALRRRVFPGSVCQSEIEIKNGLNPGDKVIIGGQHKLTDGALIRIADDGK